jgi:hypothetical protein
MARFVPVTVTPERLAELDEEHDGVVHFSGTEDAPFCYVIRRPTSHELTSYNGLVKQDQAMKANRLLLKAICVYPDTADQDRQIERWPISPQTVLQSARFSSFTGGVALAHQK